MNLGLQRWGNPAGMMVSILLILLRLTLPGFPMPHGGGGQDAVLAGIVGAVPICHGSAADASPVQRPAEAPGVPMHDCPLCPVCHLAAGPVLLPEAVSVTTSRLVGKARLAPPPLLTGPLLPTLYAARSRGPPAFLV